MMVDGDMHRQGKEVISILINLESPLSIRGHNIDVVEPQAATRRLR
jgi:hypothetical protein